MRYSPYAIIEVIIEQINSTVNNRTSGSQHQDSAPDLREGEISLVVMLRFLKISYKTILIFELIGFAAAIAYLLITPKQYEAIAQISMAQMTVGNSIVNPIGVNIEEPPLLIARLSRPTSYTPQVLSACKANQTPNSDAILAKLIKITQPKGLANIVEIRTFGASPQDAESCGQAVYELIKTSQEQILAPYISESKTKLLEDRERLNQLKKIIEVTEKTSSFAAAAYLATRDEMRSLLDEITMLKNIIENSPNRAAKLIAPIYVNNSPVAPKKQMVLAGGILGGLFLGVFMAFARPRFVKLKDNICGV